MYKELEIEIEIENLCKVVDNRLSEKCYKIRSNFLPQLASSYRERGSCFCIPSQTYQIWTLDLNLFLKRQKVLLADVI